MKSKQEGLASMTPSQ